MMQQGSGPTTPTTMMSAPQPPTTAVGAAQAAAAVVATTLKENGGGGGGQDDQQYQQQQCDMDKTKLIVNYIPQFATEEDLAELFGPIGKIESIKIMRDYKTGYSFGFGFVKYFAMEDAAKAIELLNGMNYKNKRLKVSYSRPPAADMKDSNLYITNLPKDVTEDDVHNLFCNYGEIVQKSVLKDKITGMPRGVAFVRFSKGEEAQAAIANLDGKLLDNAMFPLSVRVAEDHGRQKAQYLDNWGMPMYNRGVMPYRGVSAPSSSSPLTATTVPYRKQHHEYQRNGNYHNNYHHHHQNYQNDGRYCSNTNNTNNIRLSGAGDYHLPFYC